MKFLSIEEAAKYLGRHRSTLDKWRADGKTLPYYQHGKKVMYAVEDLDNYMQSIRVEAQEKA